MTTFCKKLFGVFSKKKKFIRFYSIDKGTPTLFPIIKSTNLSRNYVNQKLPVDTLASKNCPGIKKIVSAGWVVPAPADFMIQTNGDGITFEYAETYRFSKVTTGMDSYVTSHTRAQTEPLLDDPNNTLKTVIKIETPWRIETDEDTLLLFMPVSYNNENRFSAATGIFDPKYGHVLNIQLFWKVLDGKTFIKAGTPLCQIIPISRRDFNTSAYDVTIDVATAIDESKEKEFNYASNCAFMASDSLGSRINRVISILNKYKT